MTTPCLVSVVLLTLAIAAGTLADRPRAHPTVTIGGYRVLAADFHTHSSMWSDGALTPWGLVLEAQRHGLDAIAITGHNEVIDGHIGRWFSRIVGGPTVLVGEEILSEPDYHVIAAGITGRVSFQQSAASAIDAVHRQGGIAIAAHPGRTASRGYDEAAIQRLDGAEICHPMIYALDDGQRQLEQFSARAPLAAIGSSDFHGIGPMGLCRTFVFASDQGEQAILDAVRARRTVVYGREGRAYGDPALIRLAAGDGRLRGAGQSDSRGGPLDWFSRISGVIGLASAILFGARR
jgi:predicted metal-dependent phosphoesterase TrpH